MIRITVVITAGVILLSACSRPSEEKPTLPSQNERQAMAPVTNLNSASEPAPSIDLGGPCSKGYLGRLALTGAQKDSLRKAKNWDALVDGAKQNVRDDCSIAYRWEMLFDAFVDAHRFVEATQTLVEMKARAFPLQFALLSKTDPAYLADASFIGSAVGSDFEESSKNISETMQRAEASLAAMNASERPPDVYVAKDACPFECCTYRKWKTNTAVQLLESIRSSNVVARIGSGVSIEALTGEVDVEPEPYVALEDLGALKRGDLIFFLDNLGEGHVNYWYNGKLKPDLGLDEGLYFYSYENCNPNAGPGSCSVRKLHPEKKYRNEWWVHLRTADGKDGWVLNTGQFENADACG